VWRSVGVIDMYILYVCVVYGMVYGVWCMVYGVVYAVWCMLYGVWCVVVV